MVSLSIPGKGVEATVDGRRLAVVGPGRLQEKGIEPSLGGGPAFTVVYPTTGPSAQ